MAQLPKNDNVFSESDENCGHSLRQFNGDHQQGSKRKQVFDYQKRYKEHAFKVS